jgi:hypothetical protein
MAVFAIFKKDGEGKEGEGEGGEDRRVTAAALAAVCNIVNEFSPLRPVSAVSLSLGLDTIFFFLS